MDIQKDWEEVITKYNFISYDYNYFYYQLDLMKSSGYFKKGQVR